MRLNAKINDETDLVNKQFVDALLAKLNDTTIADLREAIEKVDDSRKWGTFGDSYVAESTEEILSILADALFEDSSAEIDCQCEIDLPLDIAVNVKLLGSNSGISQGFYQEVE